MNKILKFPKNFLWGVGTSSHQVEGGNFNNDWWLWEQKLGQIQDGSKSGEACKHWDKFKEDFALLKKINCNAYRMSLEWSRIEPVEGQWDYEALAHYEEMLKLLKQLNIKVFLTLHHFTNPQWFIKKGGWLSPQASDFFMRYARLAVSRYADLVDNWITFNEPTIYPLLGYVTGFGPPGIKNYQKALQVFNNIALAHNLVYLDFHSFRPKIEVGIAHNFQEYTPYRKWHWLDRLIVSKIRRLMHKDFLNLTEKHHDFLGINYYSHTILKFKFKFTLNLLLMCEEILPETSNKPTEYFESFPRGLYQVLLDAKQWKLPIYITENGIPDSQDTFRPKFITDHLGQVHKAIANKIDIRGYFHWSLMDSFEWVRGFTPRFGLVAIDFKNQKRSPRKSAGLFAKIARENSIQVNK